MMHERSSLLKKILIRKKDRTKVTVLNSLILFDHMNLQIVKINVLHKGIPGKSCFGMPLEILDIGVQPDRLAQVEFHADVMQCTKNLVCARICGIITDHGIGEQMIILKNFSP